jgi:hypothetical protein
VTVARDRATTVRPLNFKLVSANLKTPLNPSIALCHGQSVHGIGCQTGVCSHGNFSLVSVNTSEQQHRLPAAFGGKSPCPAAPSPPCRSMQSRRGLPAERWCSFRKPIHPSAVCCLCRALLPFHPPAEVCREDRRHLLVAGKSLQPHITHFACCLCPPPLLFHSSSYKLQVLRIRSRAFACLSLCSSVLFHPSFHAEVAVKAGAACRPLV